MMGLFEHWPYVNFHDMNLDWIINRIKNVETAEANSQASAEASAESAAASQLSADASLASQEAAHQSELNAAESEENAAESEANAKNYADNIGDPVSGIVTNWLNENITPTTPPVDESLSVSGAAADAAVTGNALKTIESEINDINIYNSQTSLAGSSNWPARSFNRNVSIWNGTFNSGTVNYYQCLNYPEHNGTSQSAIVNTFPAYENMISGKTYRIKASLLSGTITKTDDQRADVAVFNRLRCPIGEEKTFTYNGEGAKLYLWFSGGVVLTNAVIAVTISEVDSDEVRLSGFPWVQGRHTSRTYDVRTQVDTASNTVSMKDQILYDPNMYFILKEGWQVAFVSCSDYIVTGTAANYINTPGKITLHDIFKSMTIAGANEFGNALSISIRKADSSALTLNDINIDDALELKYKNSATATDPVKWIAIGDSITDGRFSETVGGNTVTKTNHFSQYGYIAAGILNIETFEEYGYGGMGYVHVANDGTYLTDILDMNFTDPDIITVNLGINDRSQTLGNENSQANDGTISGAVRNCCEVLGDKYKNAHIIFMTPLNGWSTGTAGTGWCKESGPTHLQDIADIIKYWCGMYGFKVIDMLNESPVNDFNIKEMIPDELHPSIDAHFIIGKYLAGEMPFRK